MTDARDLLERSEILLTRRLQLVDESAMLMKDVLVAGRNFADGVRHD